MSDDFKMKATEFVSKITQFMDKDMDVVVKVYTRDADMCVTSVCEYPVQMVFAHDGTVKILCEESDIISGAEDATLGKRITDKCRDVVYVPTTGCMNLAATVNVVLYDRMAKQLIKYNA